MTRLALIALITLSICACSAPATVEPEATAPEAPAEDAAGDETMVQPEWDALDRVQDTCGMRVVRGFLGRLASEIPAERLPEQVRILAPTDQATMDYVPVRLNILTDEEGRVIGMKCG